jgi:phage-related protein
MANTLTPKPLRWMGSSLEDLREFPKKVRSGIGLALRKAQYGGKFPNVKPLKGFGGAGGLEVVEDYDGDTYRAVYTVKFAAYVYVLHAFQKKSKQGIATPKAAIDLIRKRLKAAEDDFKETNNE